MRMGCVMPLASRAKLMVLLRRRAGAALAPDQNECTAPIKMKAQP